MRPDQIPRELVAYKRTPSFSESTVPAGLLADHATEEAAWALIHVEEGALRYFVTDPRREAVEHLLTPEVEVGVVEPTILHRIEPVRAVRFHVLFLRQPGGARPADRGEAS